MPDRRRFLIAAGAFTGCGMAAAVQGAGAAPRAALHAIERRGRAPVVLFLHGFGQSTAYWQEWVERLGNCGVHAIAVDLPGFGRSAQVAGPYNIEGLADAVGAFIANRKLGAVVLVGSSMGSTVAQFVTLRHPALVRRLLLTATSATTPTRTAPPADPAATRDYWAKRDIEAMVNGFFEAKAPPATKAAAFYEAGHQMNVDAAVEANESNLSWRTLERLGEIKVPALIIQGRHDRSKSPEQGALMASLMPQARLVVLEDAAHTPQWDDPEEFTRAALPFLLEERPRSRACTPAYSDNGS